MHYQLHFWQPCVFFLTEADFNRNFSYTRACVCDVLRELRPASLQIDPDSVSGRHGGVMTENWIILCKLDTDRYWSVAWPIRSSCAVHSTEFIGVHRVRDRRFLAPSVQSYLRTTVFDRHTIPTRIDVNHPQHGKAHGVKL